MLILHSYAFNTREEAFCSDSVLILHSYAFNTREEAFATCEELRRLCTRFEGRVVEQDIMLAGPVPPSAS